MTKPAGSIVERQISQLREYVEDRQELSDTTMLRQMASLDEQLKELKSNLEEQNNKEKNEGEEDSGDDSDNDSHADMDDRLVDMEEKLTTLTDMVKK